ncbi:MAG: electron transfer flavoprotein subunit beta/FixA family protein [bacterium]
MKLAVCLKQVPSTETKVRVNTRIGRVDLSEVEWVINPYDEYAIETALRLKEQLGDSTVTAVTLGPERARTALKTALAMGADEAVHVLDDAAEEYDFLARGRLLAAALESVGQFDVVLCGKQAVDDDLAAVPQAVAHFLDYPHVAVVPHVELEAGATEATCHREVEGATEIVKVRLPCLVTIQKGSYEPRYPTLKGMMAAKKKDIPVRTVADLGLDPQALGRGPEVAGDGLPPGRKPGMKLESEPADAARELVRLLTEEAKVL